MNNFFQQLKKEALDIKLSHDEKQSMRLALHDAMRQAPAPAREVAAVRTVRSTYSWFAFISPPPMNIRWALPVAALLIVSLSTGTAFAAQGSLPGDALYAIKINVTEPVQVALAATPAAKAQVEASLADRRVAEAQTLAAQGRLDATTTQELEDNFDEHAASALAFASEEAATTSSASTSVTVSITAAATSTGTASTSQEGSGEGNNAPRAALFISAPTTPRPTSTIEASATTSAQQSAEDSLFVSLQKQRSILNSLKPRAAQRKGEGGRDGNQNGNSTATTSTSVQATTTPQEQINSNDNGPTDNSGPQGGSDGEKNQSDDGSIIHGILNNF